MSAFFEIAHPFCLFAILDEYTAKHVSFAFIQEKRTALIDKNVKNQKVGKAIEQKAIFKLFTLGVSTNRDNWAYDFDKEQLEKKIKCFLKLIINNRKDGANYDNKKRKCNGSCTA